MEITSAACKSFKSPPESINTTLYVTSIQIKGNNKWKKLQ